MPDSQSAGLTPEVILEPVGRRVRLPVGGTVLDAARAAGVEMVAACGGVGACDTCRVRCLSGDLSEPSTTERGTLDDRDLKDGFRLACQAEVQSDVRISIPPESLATGQRLQLEGDLESVDVDPVVSTVDCRERTLGLALDLGTTKIAGYLVDLNTGEVVSAAGAVNPQVSYGDDVVSRIAYANRHDGGRDTLQDVIRDAADELAGTLCDRADVDRRSILDAVAVGNTAMHHFFVGLPVRSLGEAPYLPAVTETMTVAAGDVGLDAAPGALVYLPPNVAGYVGGDHIAMLLASGVQQVRGPAMALDIGTNTEVSLLTSSGVLTCSCASGPAFEGAHIRDGMRAIEGAVERVSFDAGAFDCHTVGERPAIGICGSGILDAVAALLDGGLLNERGSFRSDSERVRRIDGHDEFVLVPAGETQHGRDIVVGRSDVNEIQLAKGAIRAGMEVLLAETGIGAGDVERFVVAGAFGTYLDVRSAIRVGMFPDVGRQRFEQVGNAAGAGAVRLLLSRGVRREGGALAERIRYVELTGHPLFADAFTDALLL